MPQESRGWTVPGYYKDSRKPSRSGELPAWADSEATHALRSLVPKGEGQRVEFMAKFPDNARDLGKEIAAFATAGGGRIFIGVSDKGLVVGLPGCSEQNDRDTLLRRVQGILHRQVAPPVQPRIRLASEGELPVLVIDIPKCGRPVYYCENVPYIRNVTESRPATPEEVENLNREWLGVDTARSVDVTASEYAHLASMLVEIVVSAEEMQLEERQYGRWFERFGLRCEAWAESLRSMCAEGFREEDHLVESIKRICRLCEQIALEFSNFTNRTWRRVTPLLEELEEKAKATKSAIIDRGSIDQVEAKGLIVRAAARARNLAERVSENEDYLHQRTEEVQSKAADIGEDLLRLLQYPILCLDLKDREALRDVAKALRQVETVMMVADGGECVRRVRTAIVQVADQLQSLAFRAQ